MLGNIPMNNIVAIVVALILFCILWMNVGSGTKEGFESGPFPQVLMDPMKYFETGYKRPQYTSSEVIDDIEKYPGERAKRARTDGSEGVTSCRECQDIDPSLYNERSPEDSLAYAQGIIERQGETIKHLRKKIKNIAINQDSCNTFYRKKLSNKYYRPKPFLADPGISNVLNLDDDDFSTKTLSTIKFLSQTRPSKYYGTEIHFPTELCGNFCSTDDPNAQFHEQIETVRPVSPTNYIPNVK